VVLIQNGILFSMQDCVLGLVPCSMTVSVTKAVLENCGIFL